MQGIRGRYAPSSAQSPPSQKEAALVVSLVSSDDESDGIAEGLQGEADDNDGDSYVQPASPSASSAAAQLAIEARALEYLNTCTVTQLVAMLGGKGKDKAEALISHRPFKTVAAVVKVKQNPKGKRGRTLAIGADIFSDVNDYVRALQSIDNVVARCDPRGTAHQGGRRPVERQLLRREARQGPGPTLDPVQRRWHRPRRPGAYAHPGRARVHARLLHHAVLPALRSQLAVAVIPAQVRLHPGRRHGPRQDVPGYLVP